MVQKKMWSVDPDLPLEIQPRIQVTGSPVLTSHCDLEKPAGWKPQRLGGKKIGVTTWTFREGEMESELEGGEK